MINKKNVLGREPAELGTKDAIHTAIVAVRAGEPLRPGQRCSINNEREAVCDANGIGVADPFLKGTIIRGQPFWLLLGQEEVPNVQHVWQHPSLEFLPPTRDPQRNKVLCKYADDLGVTYEQLMAAAGSVVQNDRPVPYPGSKSGVEVATAQERLWDLWSEWSEETLHEFPNNGTECCPEYDYPQTQLFKV